MRSPGENFVPRSNAAPSLLRWWALLLVLSATGILPGIAADDEASDYVVRNWRVDDGLPHNTVNRIVQDRRGFLWIASAGGLARFDGLEFQEYPLPLAPLNATANMRDVAREDDDTLVLAPATGGVWRFRAGIFREHPASSAVADRTLTSLFQEPRGALWLVSTRAGLLRWQDGRLLSFGAAEGFNRRNHRVSFAVDENGRTWIAAADYLGWFADGKLRRLEGNFGSSVKISSARGGGFWVATNSELLRMEKGTLRSIATNPSFGETLAGLQDMIEHVDGSIWFASRRHGILRFADGRLVPVPGSHEQVVGLLSDAEGNVWSATSGGGIDRLRPKPFIRLETSNGLVDKISSSVCEDGHGNLWLANRRGGIARLAGDMTLAHRIAPATGDFFANVVHPAPDGSIWVGAQQGVFRVPPGTGAQLEEVTRNVREVHVMFVARNGDVWIGASNDVFGVHRGGRFLAFSNAEGYSGRRVKAIAEDSAGRLWVATDDRQVFEMVDGKLTPRITSEGMPGGQIYAMLCDQADFLWLATSRGVVLQRRGQLHCFTTAEGLTDNLVSQVLADGHGRLWFASRRGIFSVARAELLAVADGHLSRVNAVPLGRDDGLVGASALDSTQPMSWRTRDGRLWFATYEGMVGVDPAKSVPLSAPPPVYLDAVLVNQMRVSFAEPLRFKANDHPLEFRFVALNLSTPERVRVRYRLVGHDPEWLETGRERRVVYSRLPPGSYVLEVTAANAHGEWHRTPARLAFAVLPVWWQTWWARGAMIALFTMGVGGFARYWSVRRYRRRLERLEREHALEKERARIARDLHDDLGGSLTRIGMLADRLRRQAVDPATESPLRTLTWLTRRVSDELESIVWTVSPRNNTWDRLACYIEQYVRNFCRETPLACAVAGMERIPALPLSPEAQHNILAVVKEALNNILKHSRATRLTLEMDQRDGAFELQIVDDGVGFTPGAAEHAERNGLRNMRTRLADLGGMLTIDSKPGEGTRLHLRQPMSEAAPAAKTR